MIRIAGADIPAPTDYQVGIMDLDGETSRTASGLMVRDRVAVKRKLELAWKYLTPAEWSQILQAVSPPFVGVTYDDPESGELKTGTFYAGDRTAGAIDYSGGKVTGWKDVKFNLIEQ